MPEKKGYFSRRDFIKTAASAGLGSTLIPLHALSAANRDSVGKVPQEMIVPTRPFGKTDVNVPILSLGGFLSYHSQLVFRQAFKMGVTYWDTAYSYAGGKNEEAIGKYFTKYPEDRKKIFLVTKAATSNPKKLTRKLNTSLQRMNTSYVDMYFIHRVSDAKKELTKEVKSWVEKNKAEGKILLFGFSTHKNMENNMIEAAKLGWIDGIMMSYNYRLMVKDEMKKAVAACVKAGIGLTAMKTQASFSANLYSTIGSETDEALNMTKNFLKRGYTAEQAKLKVVWENPHIASICSAMSTMTILQANVAAALNKQPLSQGDKKRLEQYAQRTAPGYCAGCAEICESVVDFEIPISDLLRYCMYHQSYGDRDTAFHLFDRLPMNIKGNILKADYTLAEKHCPQKIQIGKVLKKAYDIFS